MGKLGKISPIPKEYKNSELQTMQGSLSQKGLTRVPGTGVFKYPYKEMDGQYRTGLDVNAGYIKRIQDPVERDLEIKRVQDLRKRLEDQLGDVDLGPRSKFWNYALSGNGSMHIEPVKLIDDDNFFDFSVPMQELTFAWLRVHPTIASSLQAYERGEYPSDTQFYVADDEVESERSFRKKQAINQAIVKFDQMTPEKKRKVARLMGLPISEDTKDHVVYNSVDNLLKQPEFKDGKYKGMSTVDMFNRFADMKENLLHVKDLVKQAIAHSVYRKHGGEKIYEGDYEVAKTEDDLVKFLMDDDNQEDLLALEHKLKEKKIARI